MNKHSGVGLVALALLAQAACGDSESKPKPDEDCRGAQCGGDGDTGDGDGEPGDGDGDTGDGDTGDGDGDTGGDGDGTCKSDADGDGVGDCNDVCPGGDDSKDADKDGTPDACDLCPGDVGPRALLWDGESALGLSTQGHAQKGIESVGCGYDRTSIDTFAADLTGGKHQILVVDLPADLPELAVGVLGELAPAVKAFVNGGGGLIFSGQSPSWPRAIKELFGGYDALPVEGDASFQVDAALKAPFDLSQVTFAPTANADAQAGLGQLSARFGTAYATTADKATTIARGMAGRAFGNSFALDDFEAKSLESKLLDVEALIGNQLVAITQSFKNELYALPYSYWAWDATAAQVLKQSVTHRARPTQWDQAPRIAMLTECVDKTSDTDDTVTPDGPYFGLLSSILAALEHAGLDSERVSMISSNDALASAIGSVDVILVPQTLSCTPSVAGMRDSLTTHIHRGGRLVYLGSTAPLLNGLEVFGTQFANLATDKAPTLASDPFWGDIESLSIVPRTALWFWSDEQTEAPALEALAYDTGGSLPLHLVFRSRFQLPPREE